MALWLRRWAETSCSNELLSQSTPPENSSSLLARNLFTRTARSL